MARYQLPKGTHDILPDEVGLWQQFEKIVSEECAKYGYEEIRTPIFEFTGVFKQENDSSDMVTKEMYNFYSGDTSYTLRPEGTKGVIRAFVEHKLYGNAGELPRKFYYIGPMFRHENPQKGRYRQFHQFGVEVLGAKSPLLDAETIALGYDLTKRLGIKNVQILLNSLGDDESRDNYRQALREYFKPYLGELCEDCQRRYQQNPLRILDCKIDRDKECFANAPSIQDYLNEESKAYFEQVKAALDDLGIPYVVDDHLVRGLDYYSNTVYEAVPVDAEGQQAAVFAGGQYDGLVDYFGGGPLPGVGFGMGMERMISLAQEQGGLYMHEKALAAYVISLGDTGAYAFKCVQKLRDAGLSAEMDYQGRGLKAQFRAADRVHSQSIIIIGEDEVANGTVQIKNTLSKEQNTVNFEDVVSAVRKITGD